SVMASIWFLRAHDSALSVPVHVPVQIFIIVLMCIWLRERESIIIQALSRYGKTMNEASKGWLNGLIGVAIFSGSLPATRVAVAGFDPVFLTAARAAIAGMMALILLGTQRNARPPLLDMVSLSTVALGVVLGFPLLSAWRSSTLPLRARWSSSGCFRYRPLFLGSCAAKSGPAPPSGCLPCWAAP